MTVRLKAEDIKQKIGDYKKAIFGSEEIISKFNESVRLEEQKCNKVLWKYRSANTSVRNTKPPLYFSQIFIWE